MGFAYASKKPLKTSQLFQKVTLIKAGWNDRQDNGEHPDQDEFFGGSGLKSMARISAPKSMATQPGLADNICKLFNLFLYLLYLLTGFDVIYRMSFMEYDEFKRQIGKAGLSLGAFAALVKINSSSITNYKAKGEVPDHWAIVAVLMGLMAENRLDFKEAISSLEITPNKPRGVGVGRFRVDKTD